jgi:PhzF family phenazine biosynthesis protein
MQIRALTCFGEHAGTGNPALVIDGDGSGEEARRALARNRDTTCVFLDGEVVDFYYPHMRSPLCIHATLAAAHVLFARRPEASLLSVTTAMRGQRLELVRDGAAYFVRLQAHEAAQPAPPSDLLARLLGAPQPVFASAPAFPPTVASVGSPKLLVEVPDAATLHALRPDLEAIIAWGKEAGVNGIYAWCRLPDGRFEGRNFNHLDPRLEDSATGVAAGALTALLGHGITLLQGRATGQACLIRTQVKDGAILIGGRAEPAAQVASFARQRLYIQGGRHCPSVASWDTLPRTIEAQSRADDIPRT